MKIQCKLKDGSITVIPNVNWCTEMNCGKLIAKAGDIFRHFKKINEYRKANNIVSRNIITHNDCIGMIEFAEAPFAIFDDHGWVIDIPYGGSAEFWNIH